MEIVGLPLIDFFTIVVYLLVLIIVGIWSSKKIKNQEDFFLAGRVFGKFIQIFAAFGQGTSASTAVEQTMWVTRNGLAGMWQPMIQTLGQPVEWFASLWWRRLRTITMGDFFEERYGSKPLAGFYALCSTFYLMVIIGMGFYVMGKTVGGIMSKPVDKLTVIEQVEYGKAVKLDKLEAIDNRLLTDEQQQELKQLRLENPRKEFPYVPKEVVISIVTVVVIIYVMSGGLFAAFLTNVIQGAFILILSVILFPFAINKIHTMFGGSGISGIVEAAKSKLPAAAFQIWGNPHMVDFTWYYILVTWIIWQISVFVLANNVTACGSAKDDYTARIGFNTGMYLKRSCVLLWGLSSLLLLIIYKGQVKDPDMLWGVACRDLLAPLQIGFVGLVIACFLATVMGSTSALMMSAAGLLTHNIVRPLWPNLSERAYINVGRVAGFLVVVGSAVMATAFTSLSQMVKLMWEFNIVMAAAFLFGLKWRKPNKFGAWCCMVGLMLLFFFMPVIVPLFPGVKTNAYLQKMVQPITVVNTYHARDVDVKDREAEMKLWDELSAVGKAKGERPKQLAVGETFEKSYLMPERSIFWQNGLEKREDGVVQGRGMVYLEMVALDKLGVPLEKYPYALTETIRTSIRLLMPFIVLTVMSFFGKPVDKARLDRFFVKMKTPVIGTREDDAKELAISYANPTRFDHIKLFPKSDWEWCKIEKSDIKAILWFSLWGLAILGVFFTVVALGS